MSLMKRLILLAAGGAIAQLIAAAATPARAETIVFDGAAAGSVQVFETAQTAAQFYGGNNFSPVPVNDNGANFFFHRDTNTGVFSLGLIVDQRGDGSGGRFQGTISGLGAGAFVAVADDNASEFSISTPGTAVFNFRFFSCCTDGGVISGLDPDNLNFSINVTQATGLTDTYLVGPSGLTSLGIAPGGGQLFSVSSAPEPDAWALFILGFIACAGAMKHARRSRPGLQPVPLAI
ncbi:MAG: hypothetical protein AAGJ87_07365 [Pseudomonadota bacterium]